MMQTKNDTMPLEEDDNSYRFKMDCSWCTHKWTHIFIYKKPPESITCPSCGKPNKIPNEISIKSLRLDSYEPSA
jgi:hypothetical protein